MNDRVRGLGRAFAIVVLAAALGACAGTDPTSSSLPSDPGPFVLFTPDNKAVTYLMNKDGQKVHEWNGQYGTGLSSYLLTNGQLLRTASPPLSTFAAAPGANGGRVELLDWDSRVVWSFDYASDQHQQHHDVHRMPNGHVLMVAWEKRTAEEALAAGRRPELVPAVGEVWPDTIIEVDPATSRIVWEWRTWDHLVPPGADPADHPGLIDVNFAAENGADWTHANAVSYNPTLDQVVLSVRNFSEIWIIDHSTNTAEAASHSGGRLGRGGDLIYRWGQPEAYGKPGPQVLFGQHNPQWIEQGLSGAGHMIIFNNGDAVARPYSTVVEIVLPQQADGSYAYDAATGYGPAAPVWEYRATPPESFFARIVSGAQRLANGNTLVCDGPAGHFFEVTTDGRRVWDYTVKDSVGTAAHLNFRAVQYEASYSGLAGRTLTPQGTITVPALTAGEVRITGG